MPGQSQIYAAEVAQTMHMIAADISVIKEAEHVNNNEFIGGRSPGFRAVVRAGHGIHCEKHVDDDADQSGQARLKRRQSLNGRRMH